METRPCQVLFYSRRTHGVGSPFADATVAGVTESSAETRYQALLSVTQHLARHLELETLIAELRSSLEPLIRFNFLALSLHNPEERSTRLRVLSSNLPPVVHPPTVWAEGESPGEHVRKTQTTLYVPEVDHETRFPEFHRMLQANGIHSYCLVPLSTAGRPLGALNFGSVLPQAYSPEETEFMEAVARQVSVAVDNALSHERLARERDRLEILLAVNNAVVCQRDDRSLFRAISSSLRERFGFDYITLTMADPATGMMHVRVLDAPGASPFFQEGAELPIAGTPAGRAYDTGQPQVFTEAELAGDFPGIGPHLLQTGIRSVCCLPLRARQQVIGTLNIGSRQQNFFRPSEIPWLMQLAGQVALALDNVLSYQRIEELNARLAKEKLYLEDEIRSNSQFEEIIGESPAMRNILHQIETVAPTDSTVLLIGETGTGKELFARALHDLSARKQRTFVKLNCAAIPTGLIESELFGHEKGAFTGAIAQHIGRFELAHGGTIFLDEIGEIPLELQPKLLRVLQEREFERLGGGRTLRVDTRLVAATNRDLARMVEQHQFRADLYYRLNVFPVRVPPLRERREDIPLLVRYFVQQFARRMNRHIETIPAESMDALVRYSWPGNIRELQNLMERAVILTNGPVLRIPDGELASAAKTLAGDTSASTPLTLEAAERAAILRALEESGGKVGGDSGAAHKLGMKRTTLQAKMRKLGIAAKSAAQ